MLDSKNAIIDEDKKIDVDVLEDPKESDEFLASENRSEKKGDSASLAADGEKYEIPWLKYLLFLGIPPPLTHRQWMVFALLSLAGFFSVYDDVLRAVCIEDIQKSLRINDKDLPFAITIIRCGAIPSFLLTLMADMIGRRPLLLVTISMYTLCTAFTAISFDIYWFTISQFFGKLFLMAEFLISNVAIIEEFDAGNRGWAMGALGAMATAGGGFALCLYAMAAGNEYGWRILYIIGVIPLGLLTYFRRQLPETRQFHDRPRESYELRLLESEGCERFTIAFTSLWTPLVKLWEEHKARVLLMSAMVGIYGLASHPAAFYQFKFLESERGYTALDIFFLGVFGGLTAVILYAFLGQASDTYGRRPFLITAYCIFFTSCIIFYNVAAEFLIPVAWIVFAGCGFGLEILNMTVISECFPTSSRATAQGFTTVAYVVGTILGLLIEGVIYDNNSSHAEAVTCLAVLGFLCPIIGGLIPETSHERLD